jgi:hypothetical protein
LSVNDADGFKSEEKCKELIAAAKVLTAKEEKTETKTEKKNKK